MLIGSAPQRPVVYAEQALVTGILDGAYAPGSSLPGERELAQALGVTRPTLREALGRLARDGWLTIQQGKPTRVNDIWREGGLNVLGGLVRYSQDLPADFIPNLLAVRLALAPAYAAEAVKRDAAGVAAVLAEAPLGEDGVQPLAAFDWQLHHALTVCSGNPIYTLILNGFSGFYEQMAQRYFARPEAQLASRAFYTALHAAAQRGDPVEAEGVTRAAMLASCQMWPAKGAD